MDSDKSAIIAVGTTVDVMERRHNDAGTLRLKIAQGWVSEKTGAGVLCFQMVSETAPVDDGADKVRSAAPNEEEEEQVPTAATEEAVDGGGAPAASVVAAQEQQGQEQAPAMVDEAPVASYR